MKHTNQRRPSPLPCGWNHRRLAYVLAPIAALMIVRCIYFIVTRP